MAVTAAQVLALGGSLYSAIPQSTVDVWLAIAAERMDETAWGARYDSGLKFLTLHLLQSFVLSGGTGGALGPIQSLTVGQVSVTYQSSTGQTLDAQYGGTPWGREYQNMARIAYPGPTYG